MNPTPDDLPLDNPLSATALASIPDPESGPASPPAATKAPPRAHSKIGRLPKVVRDKLNFLLRDGVAYPDIVTQLGDEGNGVTARNISSWHNSPHHQQWLLHQDWLDTLRADQESALDVADGIDSAKFNAAVLQLAVTQLFKALRHPEAGLDSQLGGNARTFANLVHALARASRETANLDKHREAVAKAAKESAPVNSKPREIKSELSDDEYDQLVNKMDQVFKVGRKRRGNADNSTEPEPAPPDNPFGSSILYHPNVNGGPVTLVQPSAPADPTNGKDGFHSVPDQNGKDGVPPSPINATIENQNSKIETPETCPNCKIQLPPRLPNGLRPDVTCQNCHTTLPYVAMTGTHPLEVCAECHTVLPPLTPDGNRPQRQCRCGVWLPPPGESAEKKTDHCLECGARLPALLPTGERPSPNCQDCGKPLHRPVPESSWISEQCRYCGNYLPQVYYTRNRPRENCVNCGGPLPPVGGYPVPEQNNPAEPHDPSVGAAVF
jgi:hypothetical protein